MNLYDVIKRPLITEKGQVARSKNNEYLFEVDRRANKLEVKSAVESLFKVSVVDVRTSVKKSRTKLKSGKKITIPMVKKAVVKLKEGSSIDQWL